MTIELSDGAVQRIQEIHRENPGAYAGLRVGLKDGGCSGYSYLLEFETKADEDDVVFEKDGARVFVHPLHLPFLAGSVLVWNDSELVSGFDLQNPNVARVCGCGESFDVST
ncbi:MAG: iron-sulfur cluster assembly accessory protein [Myxococcales bacterium]|nr:iron-sulfur cluster assembly accessory protein [Myxococcales bacterium]